MKTNSEYLSLIYNFGEHVIDGNRIIDHLVIRQNFSYWWMTLLTEKCNLFKSPQINNIIKLMALELWLHDKKYQKIKFISANEDLSMAVSLLANKMLIDFEWVNEKSKKSNKSLLRRAFQMLPNILKSPIWLLHYIYSNWALKGVGLKEWNQTNATTTFVSYLFNLAPESIKRVKYESPYWGTLTDLIDNNQHSTNWLHIYVKDNILPSAKKARDLIKGFNYEAKGSQVHVTLASFLSAPLIFHTLKDWYKVLKLNKIVGEKIQINSGYLWPLLKKDYLDSMSGIPAMNNLLYFNLFEKAMNELPIQNKGCYLQENKGWEFGFISAWKDAGHKKGLIGFPHTTTRFWDLRYFFDPLSYNRKEQFDLPMPNYVGVNGEAAKNMFLSGGYPKENLIELESLRHLYLHNYSAQKIKKVEVLPKKKIVLVVLDYVEENSYKQLNLLSSALKNIDKSIQFIIKPHPARSINIENFPNLRAEVSSKPIHELIQISDILYSSSLTSASVDGYCAGLTTITLLDGKTLNMSALRDAKGVYFVEDPEGLSSAINTIKVSKRDKKEYFFYLDPSLSRWKKWLMNNFE